MKFYVIAIVAILIVILIWALLRKDPQLLGTSSRANVGTSSRANVGTSSRANVGTSSRANVGTSQLIQSILPPSSSPLLQARGGVAALLELSGGNFQQDSTIKETIELTQGTLGINVPIYDTKGSIAESLRLLDQLYAQGYRTFIGFSRSSILEEVKSWFNSHPDTLAISPLSTSSTLSVNDNIVRLLPNNTELMRVLSRMAASYTRVIVMGEKGDVFAQDGASELSILMNRNLEFVEVDLTTAQGKMNLTKTLNKLDARVLVVSLVVLDYITFEEVANASTGKFIVIETGVTENPPTLIPKSMPNRYFFLSPFHQETDITRSLENSVNGFSYTAYDALIVASNTLQDKITTCGTNGIIPFDENQDRIQREYATYKWNGGAWKPVTLTIVDVELGTYDVAL